MQVNKIHDTWGTTVEFDTPTDFFKHTKEHWSQMLYDRKLIVFKRMNFTELDFAKFSHYFGTPWKGADYDYSHERWTEITDPVDDKKYVITGFSNKIISTKVIGISEMPWHADIPNRQHNPFPHRALWMVKNPNPETSGQTRWLNIEDGIEYLTPELKELLPRVKILQQSWYKEGGDNQMHDFVKVHPVTGRKSLRLNFYVGYPNGGRTDNAWIKRVFVDGVEQPDQTLIQRYIDHLLSVPELYYQHRWDDFDIAIYDNYPFIHGRTALDLQPDPTTVLERKLLRVNIDHSI